jgi:hypothetical protein
MAYNRPPQVSLAGVGLTQNPLPSILQPAGIIPVTLDADIATTSSLGIIQVGTGLSITAGGVLSTSGGSGTMFGNVTQTAINYTATADDYYIGATAHPITITLPAGILGRIYVIKNQSVGNITLTGTGGQTIDASVSKVIGAEDYVTVIFNGTRWNTI